MSKDTRYLVLDLATTVLPDAEQWIADDPIEAPSNWKDEAKIAEYIKQKRQERLDRAALDPDCCRVSCVGAMADGSAGISPCLDEATEAMHLDSVAEWLANGFHLITFNGFRFDLPILARRALYLGVDLSLEWDRYRSPHVDLYERLTHHGLSSAHGLSWYVKRFGWTDLHKPLTGAEEARAPQEGRWDELCASVRHDVIATARLAEKLRVLPALPILS